MSNVATEERIPNNVNLSGDKRLQRALEAWQPSYINWWKEMGPSGFQADEVFLRTAVSVTSEGWAHFGRDGREEAEALLERRSGDRDKPRILGAFNEPCTDWLSFFMFTFFTDRDGKFQLLALAESAFDPLSRTTRFMLTEEAHHMFVGETGVLRVVDRTAQQMAEKKVEHVDQVRALGLIDLPTMQK